MKTRKRRAGRRKASPAQLAALAKGRAARKAKLKRASAAPSSRKRKSRRSRRRGSLLSKAGTHRPVVKVSHGRMFRPKRSTIPSKAVFANPFLGELAMIGNPKRRKKSHKKAHRSYRRRRSHALFANPGGKALSAVLAGPKEMASVDFIKDAAAVSAGFILPNMVLPHLPIALDSAPKKYAAKIAVVAGLSAAANMVSKRASKMILLGGGVSILLDAWVDFVSPMIGGAGGAPARVNDGMGTYYGDGVGTYYGDGVGSVAESFA